MTSPCSRALAVTLGVCSDICMPVDAEFELPLDFREEVLARRMPKWPVAF